MVYYVAFPTISKIKLISSRKELGRRGDTETRRRGDGEMGELRELRKLRELGKLRELRKLRKLRELGEIRKILTILYSPFDLLHFPF
ncbi:MAG: hypothetical protein F6J92_15540 [Symploca sp. SIO1A3]|nr:hypothetical protein [Symploca sp. SIO1A3]